MAFKKIQMAMALLLVTMSSWRAMAQSTDCSSAIIGMSSCLNYIQGKASTPPSGCCSQLSSVVSSQPQCLCQVLNGGGSSLGISINQTQALELPKACKVQTPPVSQCKSASSPTKAPSGSGSSPASPSTLPPAGKGTNAVPSPDNNSSDGNPINKMAAAPLMFLALFVATYVSAFISSP